MNGEEQQISKRLVNWVIGLQRKKSRDGEGVFVAEGKKLIEELLPLLPCRLLVVADDTEIEVPPTQTTTNIRRVDSATVKKISSFTTPQGCLAVFEKPQIAPPKDVASELVLALDTVQDPGNLGTIIRIADWFGIQHIFCSHTTADVYNPKVVQATMGAISRVNVHAVNLFDFVSEWKGKTTIYATVMNGENIYTAPLSTTGIVIMGNEGNGISTALLSLADEMITIPNFSTQPTKTESLNVGVATAVVVAEFRKR